MLTRALPAILAALAFSALLAGSASARAEGPCTHPDRFEQAIRDLVTGSDPVMARFGFHAGPILIAMPPLQLGPLKGPVAAAPAQPPSAAGMIPKRLQFDVLELGAGSNKSYIIHVTDPNKGKPISVLRGSTFDGGLYQGEMSLGNWVKFRGHLITDGTLMVSHSSDVGLLKIAFPEGIVLTGSFGETFRAVASDYARAATVNPYAGLSLDVGQVGGEGGGPLHFRVLGGPEFGKGVGVGGGGALTWEFF